MINKSLVEVLFTRSQQSFNSNTIGYGSISNNGMVTYYQVILSDKSPLGFFLSMPSKRKTDGTYQDQTYFPNKEDRAIIEQMVLEKINAVGITIKPAKQKLQTQAIFASENVLNSSKVNNESTNLNTMHSNSVEDSFPY